MNNLAKCEIENAAMSEGELACRKAIENGIASNKQRCEARKLARSQGEKISLADSQANDFSAYQYIETCVDAGKIEGGAMRDKLWAFHCKLAWAVADNAVYPLTLAELGDSTTEFVSSGVHLLEVEILRRKYIVELAAHGALRDDELDGLYKMAGKIWCCDDDGTGKDDFLEKFAGREVRSGLAVHLAKYLGDTFYVSAVYHAK